MDYTILADTSLWSGFDQRNVQKRTYGDVVDHTGSVRIEFEYNGSVEVFENNNINIPLFLTEFKMFISKVNSNSFETWCISFSPFVHGMVVDGNLIISSGRGDGFMSGVLSKLSEDDVKVIERKVDMSIDVFGSVSTDN